MTDYTYDKLKIALTGDFYVDQKVVFNFIFQRVTTGDKYIPTDVLILAASYLGDDITKFRRLIIEDEDMYVAVLLLILRDGQIDVFKRKKIADLLVEYAKKRKPTNEPEKGRFNYNLTSNFEKKFYQKVANTAPGENLEEFPYYAIYYEAAYVYIELGQQVASFPLLGHAHQWNPFSPKVIHQICEWVKREQDEANLMRISSWFLRVVYSFDYIGIAMRYVGYSYYLTGEYEKAYAFYYQSLRYEEKGVTPNLNDEMNEILAKLGIEEPYELTPSDLKKLFPNAQERPVPSETVFDVVRELMVEHFYKEEYTEVLRFAPHYEKVRPSDTKIARIIQTSQTRLD